MSAHLIAFLIALALVLFALIVVEFVWSCVLFELWVRWERYCDQRRRL